MSLFRFGKKKKKNQSCGDVVGSPDMWAAANGIGMQAPYETARTFGGAAQKNMVEMTEPISLPGQNQYGATKPLMAPAYDSVGATEPLNTPVQHLQSAAPILPFTDGNYGGAEPLHVPVEDFYGVTEPLEMPDNGKYSAAELQGTPMPNGFGETEPLVPPSGYVPGFVPPNPASLMQDLSNHSGDTCVLMPQMPAATFFVVRTGQSVPMQGTEFSIGADPSCCNLVLQNDYISKRQVTVSITEGGYTVVDHGSTNGTTLNGAKLQPNRHYPMRSGDRLILANEIVDFEIQGDSK